MMKHYEPAEIEFLTVAEDMICTDIIRTSGYYYDSNEDENVVYQIWY